MNGPVTCRVGALGVEVHELEAHRGLTLSLKHHQGGLHEKPVPVNFPLEQMRLAKVRGYASSSSSSITAVIPVTGAGAGAGAACSRGWIRGGALAPPARGGGDDLRMP